MTQMRDKTRRANEAARKALTRLYEAHGFNSEVAKHTADADVQAATIRAFDATAALRHAS